MNGDRPSELSSETRRMSDLFSLFMYMMKRAQSTRNFPAPDFFPDGSSSAVHGKILRVRKVLDPWVSSSLKRFQKVAGDFRRIGFKEYRSPRIPIHRIEKMEERRRSYFENIRLVECRISIVDRLVSHCCCRVNFAEHWFRFR